MSKTEVSKQRGIRFDTFGPYTLKARTGLIPLDQFWKKVDEENSPRARDLGTSLANAVGIYIIAEEVVNMLVPLYVGKTDAGFRKRLKQHAAPNGKLPNFFGTLKASTLHIFLIARLNASGRLSGPVSIKRKSIDRVEFALIGSCLARNPNLRNKSQKTFHSGLVVPGFLDDPESARTSAATRLARMLARLP